LYLFELSHRQTDRPIDTGENIVSLSVQVKISECLCTRATYLKTH